MVPRREFRQISNDRGQTLGVQAGFISEAVRHFGIRTQAQNGVAIFRIVKGNAFKAFKETEGGFKIIGVVEAVFVKKTRLPK
jgi:hypothetical protein